jgi:hypothetical protein
MEDEEMYEMFEISECRDGSLNFWFYDINKKEPIYPHKICINIFKKDVTRCSCTCTFGTIQDSINPIEKSYCTHIKKNLVLLKEKGVINEYPIFKNNFYKGTQLL